MCRRGVVSGSGRSVDGVRGSRGRQEVGFAPIRDRKCDRNPGAVAPRSRGHPMDQRGRGVQARRVECSVGLDNVSKGLWHATKGGSDRP